jgi:hypothetical protein
MRRKKQDQGQSVSSASRERSSRSTGRPKIDTSERALLSSVERREWTPVERLASVRGRYTRFARATLRRKRDV